MPSPEMPVRSWRPLIVCPSGDTARLLSNALAELGVADVSLIHEYPRMGTIAALAAERRSNIGFLDTNSNPEHALLLIAELAPAMPVVAIHARKDADLILRALRSGAAEFLSAPGTELVKEILERLSAKRAPSEMARSGTVFCVVPGKPGSGASTLAAQLACEMKRRGTARVLLADLDASCGSIAFQLKLKSDFHVGDAVRDAARLDDDLWERLTVRCEGVDVLVAPASAARDFAITPPVAAELLGFLRPRYDSVVLDLPGAAGAVATGCALLAQEVLLVTSNELAVLHATRRTMEYLEQEGVERARLRLIVSRYTQRIGLKREDVKAALGVEPYAVLGSDPVAVQGAILEGKPLASSTGYSRAVGQIARQFQNPIQVSGKKRHSGWLGLFGKGR